MEYIYGALLLHSAGKDITEGNVKKIIEATGEKIDDSKVKALISALDGVDIEEAISQSVMPVSAPPVEKKEKKEEKKEEKTEEKAEEKAAEAASGLANLFG